jgi:poly(hydroxyalkanoate) depolymerase family esterase
MKIASCFALVVALLAADPAAAALTKVDSFGSNPGALVMYEYAPAGLPSGRPIVLVLHGCTQQAIAMENAGWNQLADTHKFTVIYPEQQTANNPVRCFNWAGEYGDPANLVRGQGENQSIIQMVDKAIELHGGDPARVFVVGFSSGAAFAAVMLATWPDRFAGGAIMSGIPYRCATSVSGAYSCQSPGVTKTAAQWGDLVRAAHAYSGARPRVQIWHGSTDATVKPANRTELVKQWTNVLGTDDTADETEMIGQTTRTAYKVGGTIAVEAYEVTGMGHAVAVGGDVFGGCTGKVAAYFEDRAICSTERAARFFGLVGGGGGGGPDVAPPTVAIVSPAAGDSVTGTVTIVVAANDDVAMGGVTLQIEGVEVGSDDVAPFQFDWDASAAGPGEHELLAIARDTSDNQAMAAAVVSVPDGGGGSGSGSGDDDDEPATDLPGCSLDASAGGSGLLTIGFAVAIVLARTRRRARVRRRDQA